MITENKVGVSTTGWKKNWNFLPPRIGRKCKKIKVFKCGWNQPGHTEDLRFGAQTRWKGLGDLLSAEFSYINSIFHGWI